MAVNVYAGIQDPIKFALTSGKDKAPVDAAPLNRVKLDLLDRTTLATLATLDSTADANVFYWSRTKRTIKGVPDIYLLELELHNSSLPVQENLIARLTLYDAVNPGGIVWKQFALNSR